MDLRSLPDEMLANIMKFCKFKAILRLRKTNVQVDRASVRYGINKPKCFVIGAARGLLFVKYKTIDMEEYPTTTYPRYLDHMKRFPCLDHLPLLEKTLKKIRSIEVIHIDRLDIDMAWLDLLDSMKHRHRIQVTLLECNYKVSLDDLKRVLSKFKAVSLYIHAENELHEENLATDKVICSFLSYAEVVIGASELRKTLPEITDKTLKQLQTDLPQQFSMFSHCANFTLSEIIKTMQIGAMNPCKSRYWCLGKMKVNSAAELDQLQTRTDFHITDRKSNYFTLKTAFGGNINVDVEW